MYILRSIGAASHLFQSRRVPACVAGSIQSTGDTMATGARRVDPKVLPVHTAALNVGSSAEHLVKSAQPSTRQRAHFNGSTKGHAFFEAGG